MKKLLLVIAALMALALVVVLIAAWWLLDADDVEPPSLPGSVQSGTLLHDGLSRSWSAYIPASAALSPPVLILLHGSGSNGDQVQRSSFYSFNVEAEHRGFIAVYPDGFENHWNDCRGSASYSANTRDIDDVGFLGELITQLVQEHGADSSRVYVAGHSNGGHMAFRMGYEAPQRVAGIAAISANLPVESNLDCERRGKAVATMIINGTEDPINPYSGGLVEVFGDVSRSDVVSSQDSAQYWANLAGYRGDGEHVVWPDRAADDKTRVESVEWSAPGKPRVVLVSVVGGGHTLPHPEYNLPLIIGRTSHEFDTAEVLWAFFDDRSFIPDDG